MKTKFTIRVIARDIRRGVIKDEDNCPVALAASRRFKRPMRAIPSKIWFVDFDAIKRIYFLPAEVEEKMIRYDQGKGMKPFSFTVRL